jgi:hypothetical protein
MSGHILKTWFPSQANLRKQKNGGQKNGDETAAGLHFSAAPSGSGFLQMCPDIRT